MEEKYFSDQVSKLLGTATILYEGKEISAETLFRESPASTRFHGAETGGLYTHCLGIFVELCKSTVANGIQISQEELATIAIVHDLCKVGLYHVNPNYNPNADISSTNAPYMYDKAEHYHHAMLSLKRAKQWGIPLSLAQRVCIRLHMGGWHQPEDMQLSRKEREWLFEPTLKHLQLLQLVNLADAKN